MADIANLELVHVQVCWTMVGQEAVAGPFDTIAEARRAGRGVYGAWVESGCVLAPAPKEQR